MGVSLSELAGEGWTVVEPPLPEDGENVVARHEGEPVKAGFLTERITDSQEEIHFRYRSGAFDLDVKVDFGVGRGMVKVERAEGYEQTHAQ